MSWKWGGDGLMDSGDDTCVCYDSGNRGVHRQATVTTNATNFDSIGAPRVLTVEGGGQTSIEHK